MTLKYMNGFETCRDDSDLRAQGWLASPTSDYVGFPGASTSVGAVGLRQWSAASAGANVVGVAAAADPGYLNTGITVNQAWTAGGFTFNANATFYGGTAGNAIGSFIGASQYPNQIVYDGTQYWAIQTNPLQVVTSTDLVKWTATPAQPSGLSATTANSVSYMGGGVVMVVTAGSASVSCLYTSNNGVSWSTQNFGASGGGSIYGAGCATGNATYPHCVAINSSATSSFNGVWVGTLGGTMTQVTSGGYAATGLLSRPKVINGYIICTLGNNGVYSAQASNASLNTTGAWTKWTYTGQNLTDVNYFQPANAWFVSGHQAGVVSIPNTGGAGTPVPPTTGSGTSVYANPVYGLMVSSTNITLAVFSNATGNVSLLTSTTGASGSWVNTSRVLPYLGASVNGWKDVYYDGTKYIVCSYASSAATSACIATTSDGLKDWQVKYMSDVTPGTTGGFSGLGVCAATAAPTSGSAWTQVGGVAWLNCSTPSAGSSTISLYTAAGTTANLTATQSSSILTHSYEVRAVAAATANSFNISFYIDGTLQGTTASPVAFGSGTSDTTSLLILNMPRSGNWQQFDDVVLTLDDGLGIVGPLGPINIVSRRPTADVSTQWTRVGTAASNALSVNQNALSSQSSNYVNTYTDGGKDVYSSTDTVPSNYKVKAVQVEAYFAKLGTSAPVANVGIKSGSTESDSANLTVTSANATYVSSIAQTDPSTGAAWTQTGANNSQFVINKVS